MTNRRRKSLSAKRAYLTKGERAAMYQDQAGLCGCGCGEPLGVDFIGEHVWLAVGLGNAGKPDALWRKECADRKTNGVRGDKSNIAHIGRLASGATQADKRAEAGGTRIPGRKMESGRGFWRGMFKRKLDGSVVPR